MPLSLRLHWLFTFTIVCSIVLRVEMYDARSGWFLACLSMSLYVAVFCRFAMRLRMAACVTALLGTSFVLGVALRSFLTYYRNNIGVFDDIAPSAGMEGVYDSGVIGGFFGIIFGCVSIAAFLLICCWFEGGSPVPLEMPKSNSSDSMMRRD